MDTHVLLYIEKQVVKNLNEKLQYKSQGVWGRDMGNNKNSMSQYIMRVIIMIIDIIMI